MKRLLTIITLCIFAIASWAQMSDDQIVEFVKKQNEAGMSQQQIAQELLKRGVSMQKLEAMRAQYMRQANGGNQPNASGSDADDRSRKSNSEDIFFEDFSLTNLTGANDEDPKKIRKIFGHDIFRSKNQTFEPNMNIATPSTYVLGPGDEVILDIYGVSQASSKMKISPDGAVTVPKIGPVQVAGLTVDQAQSKVRSEIGSHYQGSNIKITVGQTRSILVNVMGEVKTPGTYTLSAFSTVFNALYMAGGITDIGTMRSIKVNRNGRIVTLVDIYDYIINGNLTGNIMLQDNDVIIVGPYENIVEITGCVKRPMFYEVKKNESLKSALSFAGGFTGYAYKEQVRVERKGQEGLSVHNVDEWDFTSFTLEDEDVISVDSIIERYKNMVEISGAVFRPGHYSITGECNSVKGLITKAGGLKEDAFTNRALIYRMNENRTRKAMTVDLKNILANQVPDMLLENEDSLVIIANEKEQAEKKYFIFGPLKKEGEFDYATGMTLEDAIIAAGGLKEWAQLSNIEVSRCLQYTDERDTTYMKTAKIFTIDIEDGLIANQGSKFTLMPLDVINIKINPEYTSVTLVYVGGEVKYPGTYSLKGKTDRLSDLIARAGGIKEGGFPEGAKLSRKMNQDEKERAEQLLELSSTKADSVDTDKVIIRERYSVGIDLNKALANPGCTEDIVLRSEDQLIIPSLNNTVKVNGEVLYPNTIAFVQGKSGSYYINQAGGISANGNKKKAYIIYANGQVSRLSKGKIAPGCEIVVPTKQKKTDNSQKNSLYLALASTVATIAAVLITALK